MTKATTNIELKSINTLRFLFSIIIVYYHLFFVQLRPFLHKSELFKTLTINTVSAELAVECFLIIAGYFLYQTFQNSPHTTISNFLFKRFFRLYPVFFFCTVINFLQKPTSLDEFILTLSFLHSTGISLNYFGALWFVGPFFWCSIFLFALLKSFDKNKSLITISFLCYFSYCLNLNNTNGWLSRPIVHTTLSLAMFRILGGLSLGILLNVLNQALDSQKKSPLIPQKAQFILFSIIELSCTYILLHNFVIHTIFKNAFTTIVIFLLLFYTLIQNKGILSLVLNIKTLSNLGKYSYSIYAMQLVSFNILSQTLWINQNFVYAHPILTITLSLLFTIFIGIITYYSLEKHIQNFYLKHFKQ